jgi:hypothetical protein
MVKTYQDFIAAGGDKIPFIRDAIMAWRSAETYTTAVIADEYDRQQNRTINQYTKYLYDEIGNKAEDKYSSNNHISSNFFHRLNNQRCSYSLANGISFPTKEGQKTDTIKARLGDKFDNTLYTCGYYALIHGVTFGFWNKDTLHCFPVTEFCPLYDEYTGKLMAGIRFWSLNWGVKPVNAVLYEEDGYTEYRTREGSTDLDLQEYQPKRAYVQKVRRSIADGEEVVGESNYSNLPIVPLYGSKLKQSTLIGMREAIDSYDLIQSGFANDLMDCAEIYWIIDNAMGMDAGDLNKFRDRLKLQHIVNADDGNSKTTPYTQDVPHESRESYLTRTRKQIYDDFGALDVTNVSGGQKTATEIEAAYEPMNEEADAFEFQIIEFVQQILSLMGISSVPIFKRSQIVNQKEQTETVMLASSVLDKETVIKKLPFITVDEIDDILARSDEESATRFDDEQPESGDEQQEA